MITDFYKLYHVLTLGPRNGLSCYVVLYGIMFSNNNINVINLCHCIHTSGPYLNMKVKLTVQTTKPA